MNLIKADDNKKLGEWPRVPLSLKPPPSVYSSVFPALRYRQFHSSQLPFNPCSSFGGRAPRPARIPSPDPALSSALGFAGPEQA
ncbi:hypothetical protein TREES_T100010764 [Tupaia chinensis]|uniref:Uncharacterized protein n=1 Tax=Tupaia chinensis TaxID=246437 RepID=L9KK88_TUPCH|nr:hypothetical protein TREES_T100010764 [Tupaia chinensis]